MKNTKSLFVLAFASLLFSCGGEKKISYELSWLSPTGSPTLAFYSEAENSNWVSTSTPAALIPAAFASTSYDAIVFDGITGLNLIEKQQRAYRLASWINEGSFYLVSAKYDKDGAKNLENKPTIDAFVASGTASVLFRDVAANTFQWGEYSNGSSPDDKIVYETGVDVVQKNLLSNPEAFDFYVVAEPALSLLKQKFASQNKALHVISDLQTDFATNHNGVKVPAAAIFVRERTYLEHPSETVDWLNDIQSNIQSVRLGDPQVLQILSSYEEKGISLAERFGFPSSNLVKQLMEDGSNKLHYSNCGVDSKSLLAMANDFQSTLGLPVFNETSVLNWR